MQVITLTAPLTATDGVVPSEFVLLKTGVNDYYDGQLVFDDVAAQSVMTRYQKRGIQLMADYEHQSLKSGLTGPIPAAAKRWEPELRNGDLYAASVQWTPRARQMLADGEYRYFSIACRVDEKTNRVTEIINFALTNLPAAERIEPLVAASVAFAESTAEEQQMKNVIVALGLGANAEEADALAAVSSLKDFERNVVALSGKNTRAEALGALNALSLKAGRADAAEAELVALKSAQAKAEINALIDAAVKNGIVEPAKRESLVSLSEKAGIDGLKACLELLPKQVMTASESVREAAIDPSGDLTPEEIRVALSMGHSLDALRASKKAFRDEQRALAQAGV